MFAEKIRLPELKMKRICRFNVILTNPPFAGKVDRERIKPTLPVKSNKTQVLFLGYVINSLKPSGRAGIILPEGSLFWHK